MARKFKKNPEDDEVDIDMTAMIDIIFLLLIFFILTTKFIPEEKVITNILPTDKGTAATTAEVVEKDECHIKIYPAQFTQGNQPSVYDKTWHDNYDTSRAKYQIGNTSLIEIEGAELQAKAGEGITEALQQIHAYIHQGLNAFEAQGASRRDQPPVIIHGFTGLPWKYVIAAYDAVRQWENERTGGTRVEDPALGLDARDIMFAPPRVRDYRQWEMGYELFEIIHTK